MLPAVVKNKIEQIWLNVIAGGVSQPTEVIEQLTSAKDHNTTEN